MTFKSDFIEYATAKATDYPNWKFTKSDVKYVNRSFGFVELVVYPVGSFKPDGLIFEFLEQVRLPVVEKIYDKYVKVWGGGTFGYPSRKDGKTLCINIYDMQEAINYLDTHLPMAIEHIQADYDLSSMDAFIQNFPMEYPFRFDRIAGVKWCILKMYSGDFEYIRRYRSGEEMPNIWKSEADLDKIIARLGEVKEDVEKLSKKASAKI